MISSASGGRLLRDVHPGKSMVRKIRRCCVSAAVELPIDSIRKVGTTATTRHRHQRGKLAEDSVKTLRTRLESLPIGSNAYDHSYTEAMQRIQGQNFEARGLALQTLAWISRAKRPLSTTEIQHALAVEQGSYGLDEDNLSEVEDILSVCAGLFVDEDSQIMRLVHHTTQEFFEREWEAWFPHAQP